jgi:heat shock protein HslJ/uncharacterized lipoprotein YbaY
MSHRVALVAALLATAGAAQAQDATRSVDGTISYLQRIALPPGAEVVVEARGLRDALLGESRFKTEGAQVPLPFSIALPSGPSATLHVAINIEGQASWLADPVAISGGSDAVTVPDILMVQASAMPVPAWYMCGDQAISATYDGAATTVAVNGETLRLVPVVSASGAKFAEEWDETTYFWSKGDGALFSLRGTEYPACVATEAPAPVYRAGGNEPGWSFRVTGDAFEFSRMGEDAITGTVPVAVWRDGAAVWELPGAGLTVRMSESICRDTMSGMPFPETVAVDTTDGPLTGCGGEPASLLQGGTWVVEDVGGNGIIDDAMVTMTFGTDGRVSGRGGCNQFNGGYTLTGEGLSFGPAASTMMACPEAVMNLEQSFFQTLTAVIRFDIADTGALMLYGADGNPVIRAFRE